MNGLKVLPDKPILRRNMAYRSSIDTNIVLRLLVNDVPSQRRRALKLLSQPGATYYLEDIAITEVVYVLETVYQYSRVDIADKLLFFLTRYDGIVEYNRSLTRTVFPFYLTHPKLSFSDCCLATLAEINDAEPLFTFDQKLARQHPSAKLV